MEWIGPSIGGDCKFRIFYKECLIKYSTKIQHKEPLKVTIGDYVVIHPSKNCEAYAMVVNLLEDQSVLSGSSKALNSFRADVIYLFNMSMLSENILKELRKIIRTSTFNPKEFFIPSNTKDNVVSNSMATIQIDTIYSVLNIHIYDSSKIVKRPNYDTLFSRFGFSNNSIVTCQCALMNSIDFIKKISGYEQPSHDEKSSSNNKRRSSRSVNDSTGMLYNISNVCNKKSDMSPIVQLLRDQNTNIILPTLEVNVGKRIGKLKKRGRPIGSKNVKIPYRNMTDNLNIMDCSVILRDAISDEIKNEIHKTKFDQVSCRDKEYRVISNFVSNHITNNTSGCLYISGVPGSGKTHTTLKVVENLMKKRKFKFIHINGMKILSPNQIYTILCKNLFGVKLTISKALVTLCDYFESTSMNKSKRSNDITSTIVLLIDELDCICNKNQSVLYHLFEWTSYNSSKLITITIANTMDLPERYLSNKISSRLGVVRLTFLPYSYAQLVNIIQDIYVDSKYFEKDALQLISRKIAAVSGDVRRCLDVCQKSIEIAKSSSESISSNDNLMAKTTRYSSAMHVSIKDVMESVNIMFSSVKTIALKTLSDYEKLFLKCMLNWNRSSNDIGNSGILNNSKSITLSHVRSLLNNLIHSDNLEFTPINSQQIVNIAYRMINSRILNMESSTNRSIHTQVSLNIQPEAIAVALGLH